ncbi:MAG: OmpA family protein [Candidatus Krumholzibacteria bacterium]|nr:OmpA family protein [Candidatus Krumholzibacteria bacterium]
MRSTLVYALALGVCIAATGCSNKELISQKDQQIAALQNEVGELEGQLASERARTEELNSELARALSDLRAKEKVWLEEKQGMTQVTIDGEVTFGSGSTRITTEGKDILDRVWNVVGHYPEREVRIEGHTDDVAIAERWQQRFRSNWELSSARAHAVLHYLMSKYAIDPQKICAVGYGEHQPIASNATDDGRAMNRRVVITIAPPHTTTRQTLP